MHTFVCTQRFMWCSLRNQKTWKAVWFWKQKSHNVSTHHALDLIFHMQKQLFLDLVFDQAAKH